MLKIILLLFSLSSNACVVLLYHQFNENNNQSTNTKPLLFEKHLKYIRNNNFTVLTVDSLIYKLKYKEILPNKCVVLTADDAYKTIYTNALPLLKKYQVKMSVFVSTDAIDKKYPSFMTYKQMTSAKKYLDFYNHSKDHSHFYNKTKKQIIENITFTQNKLKEKLAVAQKIFAYPYGEYDINSYNTIKNLGFVSFGQHSGAISLNSDIHNLPRFPVAGNYADMNSFITKINSIAFPEFKILTINQIITKKQNPPTLSIKFKQKFNLSCFVKNQQTPNIIWDKDNNDYVVNITAHQPLKLGRNKYNCTAKSAQKGRFYWISKQWLVL